jgi:hypothetical protein
VAARTAAVARIGVVSLAARAEEAVEPLGRPMLLVVARAVAAVVAMARGREATCSTTMSES